MERSRLDRLAPRAQRIHLADVDLRSTPRLLETHPRQRRRAFDVLSRDRTAARRLCEENELHARRADAGHGTSLLWLVGLPDHRLLCADEPLWDAAGPEIHDRRPARER